MARGVEGKGKFNAEAEALAKLDEHRAKSRGGKKPLDLKPSPVEVIMGTQERYANFNDKNNVTNPTVLTPEEEQRQKRQKLVEQLREQAAKL